MILYIEARKMTYFAEEISQAFTRKKNFEFYFKLHLKD